jgi:hypothetical protein
MMKQENGSDLLGGCEKLETARNSGHMESEVISHRNDKNASLY